MSLRACTQLCRLNAATWSALLVFCTTAGNAVAREQSTAEPEVTSCDVATSYTIEAGDVLQLSIFDIPELSQSLLVSETGTIHISHAGDIHVRDHTMSQASQQIEVALKKDGYLREPEVDLELKDLADRVVAVGGMVTNREFIQRASSKHFSM